jgi:hypothetical protein
MWQELGERQKSWWWVDYLRAISVWCSKISVLWDCEHGESFWHHVSRVKLCDAIASRIFNERVNHGNRTSMILIYSLLIMQYIVKIMQLQQAQDSSSWDQSWLKKSSKEHPPLAPPCMQSCTCTVCTRCAPWEQQTSVSQEPRPCYCTRQSNLSWPLNLPMLASANARATFTRQLFSQNQD